MLDKMGNVTPFTNKEEDEERFGILFRDTDNIHRMVIGGEDGLQDSPCSRSVTKIFFEFREG